MVLFLFVNKNEFINISGHITKRKNVEKVEQGGCGAKDCSTSKKPEPKYDKKRTILKIFANSLQANSRFC